MAHITTEEARSRNLPGSDTFHATHIAYVDDLHRHWAAVRLNVEAMKAFLDTVEISERVALAEQQAALKDFIKRGGLAAGLDFPTNEPWRAKRNYINYEYLKIACGFELHLKARLIARGYLAHLLDSRSVMHRSLAGAQKERPIAIGELLDTQPFHFDGTQNYLPGVGTASVKFSWLTDKSEYRKVFDLADIELDLIKDLRLLRNQIHLPSDDVVVDTPALRAFGAPLIEFLLPFINRELVEWSNSTIAAYEWRFRPLEPLN
jgi:hypothetical protein